MRDFGKCEKTRCDPVIPVEAHNCRFVIRNPKRLEVRVVDIECFLKDADWPRCDWLFVPAGDPTEVYVELKRTYDSAAIRQIEETIPRVSENKSSVPKVCYIVSLHNPVPRWDTTLQRARTRFGKRYNARLLTKKTPTEHKLTGIAPPKRST